MNPRYEAYKKITNNPTNWGYMDFINKMKIAFCGDLYGHIYNQDAFTNFINKRAEA